VRILQINNYADPIGGAEVYALALTRELARRGHRVAFFGTSPEREAEEETLRIVRRPRYDATVLYRDPLVCEALRAFAERFRPELVHVHNVFSLGLDVLALLGSFDAPIVQTVHDFSLLCPNSWCVRGDGTPCRGGAGAQCFRHECQQNYPYDHEVALNTLLKQRLLASSVDMTLCPSRHLAELMRAGGARNVRHLNYFIDPIEGPGPRSRASKELVFIGRLEPEKGVDTLLKAMPAVLAVDPEVRLTLVGGGSRAAALEQQARTLGLGASVVFRSHVPRAELGQYYASATACVLPSIWTENSPLVAYECLCTGLPMIASRIGGIPELAEHGKAGLTFEPRDSADLAGRILEFLALPPGERERMSEWMRARARAFGSEEHLALLTQLYAELSATPLEKTSPTLSIDGDLLELVGGLAREKSRLGGYFREHVAHIAHLERVLAERAPETEAHSSGHGAPPLEGKTQILKRLARALHIPRGNSG
jgi:glycosyltransferase involved in cell wall biosynthesis